MHSAAIQRGVDQPRCGTFEERARELSELTDAAGMLAGGEVEGRALGLGCLAEREDRVGDIVDRYHVNWRVTAGWQHGVGAVRDNARNGQYSTLNEVVQPLSRSPTMMLGRSTVMGSRSRHRETSNSASNFDCS